MHEPREKLQPLQGKRTKFRGTLTAVKSWQVDYREVGRACIESPEVDCEVMCSHVWVMNVPHWPKDYMGQQVEFSAVVQQNTKQKSYCLHNPSDVTLVYPTALLIPNPPNGEDVSPEPAQDDAPAPESAQDEPPAPEPAQDPLQCLRHVKAFMKACGGYEQANKVLTALQSVTMPLSQLGEWMKVLNEE